MSDYNPDFNDLELLDEVVEYDPDAELNPIFLAPDGKHLAQLELGQNGVSGPKRDKNGRPFITVHVLARIIAPGKPYDKSVVFDRATSIVFSSGTSPVHALLKAAGNPAPSRCSLGQLKELVEETLAGKPVVIIRTQWEASAKNQEGKYEVVKKGMRNFPQNEDGTYNPTIEHNGEPLAAQVAIRDYLPAEAVAAR